MRGRARLFLLVFLFVLVLMVMLSSVAYAQEVPVDVTPEVDSSETSTLTDDALEAITENERTLSWTNIVYGVIIAIAGGGTFAFVLHRLDRRTKDELERNYLALSPKWQDVIIKALDVGENVRNQVDAALKLGRELTDGKPNADSSPPPGGLVS